MHSVYIKTLGCKVNTFDARAIENQFEAVGYAMIPEVEKADITVINTCSVTANADKEARYYVRKFRRDNPEAMVVVTGCYAQTDSARLAAMEEVDLVVPNEAKDRLVDLVQDWIKGKEGGQLPTAKLPTGLKEVKDNRQSHFKSSLTLFDKADSKAQTRAFLKIQDGCNSFCTYCLIPYARGASRSVAHSEVTAEIKRLVQTGTKEIVLTGIHIGEYGNDLLSPQDEHLKGQMFLRLLQEMVDIEGLERIRISSMEPQELSEPILKFMASFDKKFCHHFHLPLQSGHDRILKLMRRGYNTQGYADTVAMARHYFPEANFGADIIPGFPGETEEEHRESMAFVQRIGLNYLHVFPYSNRPNTAASKMPGHLPVEVVKERAAELRELSDRLKEEYTRRYFGKVLPVLWENDQDDSNRQLGHTSNYLHVAALSDQRPEAGSISSAQIKGFLAQGKVLGKIQ